MVTLTEHNIFIFVAQLGVIIFAARLVGEIAKRLGQPILVGEVIAGVILGPSVFGTMFPSWRMYLFPVEGPNAYLLEGFSWLCVLFLLMITGLEIDISASLRHGKRNLLTSILGLALPFIGVYALSSLLPLELQKEGTDFLHTRLILATALAVVAIPVIAKILFDLKILRSFVGLNVITAGVLSDIWGWSILAVILSLIVENTVTVGTVVKPFLMMVVYIGFTVTAGRWIVDKIFDFIGITTKDATPVLALLFALTLLNGAIAHLLHIHVIFGAFVAGIMAGESHRITPYMRQSIEDFIFAVFAPIFFVLVGMQLNLSSSLNWGFIAVLFIFSTLLKVGGSYLGAFFSGIGQKNALAVGCGLATQGTMGIIVGLLGLEVGAINESLFTVIVLICILTSIIVGPTVKWAIQRVRRPLADYFDPKYVFLDVEGDNKKEIITEVGRLMEEREIVADGKKTARAIMGREEEMSTAIGDGVAVPHARLTGLNDPILCFFRLKKAIDFNSPDNKPVRLLFLELTDRNDDGMQLNLISQVARFVSSPKNISKLLDAEREEDIHHLLSLDEKV